MYVPASDGCNQVNIDIDTGSTSTTRKWQIKVTQYECNNMMSPEQDCLQYHTASTGTVLKICLSIFLFMASLKLLPPLFPFLHTFPLSSFFFTISFLFSCFIIPSLSFFSFLTFFSLLSVISSLSSLYCFSPSTSPLYPSFPFFLNSLPFLNYTLFWSPVLLSSFAYLSPPPSHSTPFSFSASTTLCFPPFSVTIAT